MSPWWLVLALAAGGGMGFWLARLTAPRYAEHAAARRNRARADVRDRVAGYVGGERPGPPERLYQVAETEDAELLDRLADAPPPGDPHD